MQVELLSTIFRFRPEKLCAIIELLPVDLDLAMQHFTSEDIWLPRIVIYMKRGAFAEAIECILKILRAFPTRRELEHSPKSHVNDSLLEFGFLMEKLSQCITKLGDLDMFRNAFNEVLEIIQSGHLHKGFAELAADLVMLHFQAPFENFRHAMLGIKPAR